MGSDDTHQTGAVDFQEFYRERWSQLRASFAWASYLGIDADDVTQETMMRARKHYERFASPDELALWCRRVGTNIIRRQIRTAYRRWERPHPSPLTAVPDAMSSDAAEQAVENADLARTMATLNPRHAQVLLLGAAGHSREDIAKILGISPAAVGMLMQRARRAARARWAKVVAAFMVLGVRIRKLQQVPSDSTSALVASVVSISIVAALGTANSTGYVQASSFGHAAGQRPPVVGTVESKQATVSPTLPRKSIAPGADAGRASGFGIAMGPASPPTMCVTAPIGGVDCGDPSLRGGGDRLDLVPARTVCQYCHATESVVPVCDEIGDNAVIQCRHERNPEWTVSPPRRPSVVGGHR
ncbi:MAG: sigma factor [Frankiaceae bacterium]|jgi:RNA polymerase sigma factor (sigma-70 family)|nr:sigma factor [Frankiaceae bacterium]